MKKKQFILRIYRKNFAQFFFFRLIKLISLNTYIFFYRLLSSLIRHESSGTYYWKSLSKIDKNFHKRKITIFDKITSKNNPVSFVGYKSKKVSKEVHIELIDQPEQSIFEFENASVMGRIDFVFKNKIAIHQDLFIPQKHQSPAENTGLILNKINENKLDLFIIKKTIFIEKAISLIGQCSHNYAHWLTECLPKLPIVDSLNDYKNWPILIDAGLHPNIVESIKLLNKNNRDIIEVKSWQPVKVKNLVVTTSTAYERYVPQGLYISEPDPYLNTFSYFSLNLLRNSLKEKIKNKKIKPYKRLFFTRTKSSNNLRRLVNSNEIESTIINYGITPIIPEKRSFELQVSECMNAELIIAPIGAALANIVFAPKGCIVVVLAPYFSGASYSYYRNLASILGHKITFILGRQEGNIIQPSQRNYFIDIEELKKILNESL